MVTVYKVLSILVGIMLIIPTLFGLGPPPTGITNSIVCQGEYYGAHGGGPPQLFIAEDSPELAYIGIADSYKFWPYGPLKEMQVSNLDDYRARVYLHDDGTLYLFRRDGTQKRLGSSTEPGA